MANRLPAGTGVGSGTYECNSCGYDLEVWAWTALPRCPRCRNDEYDICIGDRRLRVKTRTLRQSVVTADTAPRRVVQS